MSEHKKETTPLTWVVTVAVGVVVFLVVRNVLEDRPYLLFESSASKKERIIRECEQEAFEMARDNLQTKVNILREKTSPTTKDLEDIEQYESVLKNNAVLREDREYYYNQCMSRK